MTDSTFPAPPVGPGSDAFYDAAAAGTFLLPHCTACGRAHWYPRALCPFCFGEVEWRPASGEGTVYSYSINRRARPVSTVAYVTLSEGPTMLTSLVDCDVDRLRIGQAVRLVWKPTVAADEAGPPVPCFTPVAADPA